MPTTDPMTPHDAGQAVTHLLRALDELRAYESCLHRAHVDRDPMDDALLIDELDVVRDELMHDPTGLCMPGTLESAATTLLMRGITVRLDPTGESRRRFRAVLDEALADERVVVDELTAEAL